MDIKHLPENKNERQFIVVVDDCFLNEQSAQKSPWVLVSDPRVFILNIDDDWEGRTYNKLKNFALLKPGTTLLLASHEESQYIELKQDTDINNILLESAKMRCLIYEEIVKHLGATYIEQEVQESKDQLINGKGNIKKIGMETNGAAKFSKKIKTALYRHSHFPGSSVDIKKANEILIANNLQGDRELKNLINLRNSNNPILSQNISYKAMSEIVSTLEFGLSCGLPGIKAISANIDGVLNIAKETTIHIKITFPEIS